MDLHLDISHAIKRQKGEGHAHATTIIAELVPRHEVR